MDTSSRKERLIGATGSVSAAASVLGSWQICHNVCLALIAALSVIGISLQGMPLLFFTTIAKPVWMVAAALLAVTLFFYFTRRCISPGLMLLNIGLVTAGVPFQALQPQIALFYLGGGVLVFFGAMALVQEWRMKRRCAHGCS